MDTTEQNEITEAIEAAPGFYGMLKSILKLGRVSKVKVTTDDGFSRETSPELFATVATAGFLCFHGIPENVSAELASMAVMAFEQKGDLTAQFVHN